MTSMPALNQHKVLLLVGGIIIAIVFAGSWYVSRSLPPTEPVLPVVTPPAAKEVMTLSITEEGTATNGQHHYKLTAGPTKVPIQSIAISLKVSKGMVISTDEPFTVSPAIAPMGWQMRGKANPTSEDAFTMELGFLNLSPEGFQVSEPLVLGEFTVATEPNGGAPELFMDNQVSTAFTKEGEEMLLDFRSTPLEK